MVKVKRIAKPRPEGEEALIRAAQGDGPAAKAAMDALVLANMGWIIRCTGKFMRVGPMGGTMSGETVEEWVSHGVEAFMRAVRTFRFDGGSNLATWAGFSIRTTMWQEWPRRGVIPVPRRDAKLQSEEYKANAARARRVVGLRMRRGGSVDYGEEFERGLRARAVGHEEASADDVRELLSLMDARAGLIDHRERRVLEMRFHEGLGLVEVGARIGVSKERARQIEENALLRLRAVMVRGMDVESVRGMVRSELMAVGG